LSISQAPIERTLPVLAAIHPDAAEEAFRIACGCAADTDVTVVPKAVTLSERRRRLGPSLSVAYADPVKLTRGWMQYLFDDSGSQYLDAYNNVPHVGHSHPRVVQATVDQMRALNTNTRYLHDTIWRFAERLCATLPESLSVCYFLNSGSEANELALRLARAHTGARDVIVLDAAYHGNTTTLIDISPYKFNGPGGGGAPDWVHVAPIPDDYRGRHKREDPDAGPPPPRLRRTSRYGDAIGDIIEDLRGRNRALSAFICETCPSVGGQIIPPPGYLETAYAHVRGAGGICIADEVQTAYGRMGDGFYAFESQGVVPDVVVLGKPIGNGYPLGAVVTTPEIAASFDNGMEFFSTFGGSTVSCAAGLAVLETVQDEDLQAHAQRVGVRLLAGLNELAARHELIGDVRGSGLFFGVELVSDRVTQAPATSEAATIIDRMRERRILIGTEGPLHNVLKIRPPMPFNEQDADRLVATLDEVLTTLIDAER
jgi:4-aminobutyrate aminotransferase-like enzyme